MWQHIHINEGTDLFSIFATWFWVLLQTEIERGGADGVMIQEW